MRRGITVPWHTLSFLLSAVLFFFFTLPRWWELSGDVSTTLGTVMRIVTGVLTGVTAVPVLLDLLRARRPEFGTPQLALTLRVWSIVGHVLAGLLIAGTAVAEIWVGLEDAGQWLFGVYGAAAALAVLGAAAFHLAYIAQQPAAPPKPVKPKKAERAEVAEAQAEDEAESEDAEDEAVEDTGADDSSEATESTQEETASDEDKPEQAAEPTTTGGRLRNRRPKGKSAARSTVS